MLCGDFILFWVDTIADIETQPEIPVGMKINDFKNRCQIYGAILIGTIFIALFLGCSSSTNISTPAIIGEKNRFRVISGDQAARTVNKLHGSIVSAGANVIAEYGQDPKDLLYITHYQDHREAQKSFDLMIKKIAAAKNGPFYYLMPVTKYDEKVYMALGIGAVHYIYRSGHYLLWLQSYQSFGITLPPQLLEYYPAG